MTNREGADHVRCVTAMCRQCEPIPDAAFFMVEANLPDAYDCAVNQFPIRVLVAGSHVCRVATRVIPAPARH